MDKQLSNVDQLRYVRKTDGSQSHNYPTWKWRLETVLELNGYIGLVTGEEDLLVMIEGNPTYEKRRKTAYAAIAFTVSDDFAKLINKTKDPKVAWEALRDHFHKKSLSNEIALDRQLCMFRMNETDSMMSHINRLKDLADSLDAIDQGLSESRKVITLLRSLPDSYTVVSTALECQSAATLKFDFVCERLLDEEAKREMKQEDAGVSKALGAVRVSKSGYTHQVRCYRCRKLGHSEADCSVHAERMSKQVKHHAKAAMVCSDSDSDVGSDCASEDVRNYAFVSVLKASTESSDVKSVCSAQSVDVVTAEGTRQGKVTTLNTDGKQFCEASVEEKLYCKQRTRSVLNCVHFDVVGPMKTTSLGGSRFVATFVDDNSRFVVVYFLKEKSQLFTAFKKFEALVMRKFDKTVRVLCTNGGGVFSSRQFADFLKRRDIVHRQTHVAADVNRTLFDDARAMLRRAGLNDSFWAEATQTAVYLRNRKSTFVKTATPFEAWYGTVPDLSHLRVFGSLCSAHVPKKHGSKAVIVKIMGYSEAGEYRLYDLKTRRFFYSSECIVDAGVRKVETQIDCSPAEPIVSEDSAHRDLTEPEVTRRLESLGYEKTRVVPDLSPYIKSVGELLASFVSFGLLLIAKIRDLIVLDKCGLTLSAMLAMNVVFCLFFSKDVLIREYISILVGVLFMLNSDYNCSRTLAHNFVQQFQSLRNAISISDCGLGGSVEAMYS